MARLLALITALLLVTVWVSTPLSPTQAQSPNAEDCENGFYAGIDGTATGQPYPTILTGAGLDSAVAVIDPNTNQWQIAFSLTDAGSEMIYAHTSTHIGQQLAIVLDGRVLSAPVIQAALRDEGVITGDFTAEEARILALQLRLGSLPLRLELIDSRFTNIGPYGVTRLRFRPVLSEGTDLDDIDAFWVQEALTRLEERLNGLGLDTSHVSITAGGNINVVIRSADDQTSIADSLSASSFLEFVDYSTASYRPDAGACLITEGQIAQGQQHSSRQPTTEAN